LESINVQDGNLSNPSLRPRTYEDRTLSPMSYGIVWFGLAVQLMIFMLAGQLYMNLSVMQVIISIILGNTIGGIVMFLTQDIGIKFGIPFSVSLRSSFGYIGAHIPSLIRGLPAMFHFGFQTWIAGLAIAQITQMLFGWSNVLIFTILFGILQIVSAYFGIQFISKFSNLAAPIMLLIWIYLLYVLLTTYDVTLMEVLKMRGDGNKAGSFPLAVMAFIGGWSALLISIQDITRECKVKKEETKSWWQSNGKFMLTGWLGLVPASVLFGGLGAISVALTSEWNPVIVLTSVIGDQSPLTATILLIFVILATWSTNVGGNLLPPGYVVSNLWPTKINYGQGVLIAGAIGLIIQPWNTADYLDTVFSILASIIAPVSGILLTDYYLIQKRNYSVDDLYNSNGRYKYLRGVNLAALIAYIVAIVLSIPVWNYMFFVGISVSAIIYYLLMVYWVNRPSSTKIHQNS